MSRKTQGTTTTLCGIIAQKPHTKVGLPVLCQEEQVLCWSGSVQLEEDHRVIPPQARKTAAGELGPTVGPTAVTAPWIEKEQPCYS